MLQSGAVWNRSNLIFLNQTTRALVFQLRELYENECKRRAESEIFQMRMLVTGAHY